AVALATREVQHDLPGGNSTGLDVPMHVLQLDRAVYAGDKPFTGKLHLFRPLHLAAQSLTGSTSSNSRPTAFAGRIVQRLAPRSGLRGFYTWVGESSVQPFVSPL